MNDFLELFGDNTPRIVQASLGLLASTLMGIFGGLLGGDHGWVVAGVFAAAAGGCLLIFIRECRQPWG